MSFETLQEEIKSLTDQKKEITIETLSNFHELCVNAFTEAIDLSKGNPKDFMAVMGIITSFSEHLTPALKKEGDEKIWYSLTKVAVELLMLKEANTFADVVLKFNKNNKLAWFYKGRYFEKEKKYEKAEEEFNKAIKIDDQFYMAWFQIASMYEKIDLETAYQKYLKIIEKFPKSMSGWKRLEEVGGKLGHYEVAMKAQKVSFDLSNDPNRTM